jgi:hypothetical protein
MNNFMKMVSVIGLTTIAQSAYTAEITDDYNTGDTLTVTTLETIKNAVNDNDKRISEIALTPGPTGTTGATGDIGASGVQGIQGIRGLDGATGAKGASGDIGASGVQGIPGSDGDQGERGIQGLAGTNGADMDITGIYSAIEAHDDLLAAKDDEILALQNHVLDLVGLVESILYNNGDDFTKISASGTVLLSSASEWACVRDNITGHVWEVKSDSGLHSIHNQYRWGGVGAEQFGTEFYDDWNVLVNGSQGLCGYGDWRVPNRAELIAASNDGQRAVVLMTQYFDYDSSYFWSSSAAQAYSGFAWNVGFGIANSNGHPRGTGKPVRLVRGGQ